MSEYLSKEEVRQWRSSLEKITLEEFAARLGKVIQSDKKTNDMVDIVMTETNSAGDTGYAPRTEKLTIIPDDIVHTKEKSVQSPLKVNSENIVEEKVLKTQNKTTKKQEEKPASAKNEKTKEKTSKAKVAKNQTPKAAEKSSATKPENNEANKIPSDAEITFSKPLIAREKMIFDYMLQNKNVVVYAKDMAELLNVPRDYVYKYIKNLRTKINEDVFLNADNGGYVLKID